MEELIFVVDELDNPLDPVPRSQAIRERLWRRASGILITNTARDQILCHKRTSNKDERPGMWVSMFGGKCDPGETPQQTVLRELGEEAGITLEEDQLHFYTKVKSDKHHQYEYIHWGIWDGDIDGLAYDREEVEQIRWFDIEEAYGNLSTTSTGWYSYSQEELNMIKSLNDYTQLH